MQKDAAAIPVASMVFVSLMNCVRFFLSGASFGCELRVGFVIYRPYKATAISSTILSGSVIKLRFLMFGKLKEGFAIGF
jgi:hypothetical protein